MLKRILDKQLELNEYEPYGGGISHEQGKKASFIDELRRKSKEYVSPKIDEIKKMLQRKADEGKTSLEIDKYMYLDDYATKWLYEQGFKLDESWRGSMEDGSTIVTISW